MTKQRKKSVRHKTRFLTELVQNNLNHSKLAAKQPKRPKCTKTENRSKTSKTGKASENSLERIFMTKQQNKIFWTKNNLFDKNCLKTL